MGGLEQASLVNTIFLSLAEAKAHSRTIRLLEKLNAKR
jgi:hypothetical protein